VTGDCEWAFDRALVWADSLRHLWGGVMGQSVLLIEDEPNIAEAIRFVLTRDGWQVSVLGDGAGALAEVARLRPDLVILDLMLPGMSGLEILTALRADGATEALPVMMLTAKGLARDREAAVRAGVSLFMTKPFANAEIVAQARALVGL
jgi:DNA-binding response OmpR family regulator